MRIALIGVGRIGRFHARALADVVGPGHVLIADIDAARAHEVAAETGATAAGTIEEATEAADALVIAAATNAHAALIIAGAKRGIPVFCEKPIALDLGASRQVVDAVEAAGIELQLGFQRRFDPGYREARRRMQSGEIGTIYALRLAGHDAVPPHESFIPTSGGMFRDMAIHDFDAVRWLTGAEVDEVFAIGAVRGFEYFAKYGDIDTAVATLRLSNGVLAAMTATRHGPLGYDIRTEIFGSKDSISIGLGRRTPVRSVEPGERTEPEPGWSGFLERFADAYRAELVEFVRVARGEAPSPCTGRDGLEALRIAEAAALSVQEHRPVRVAEIVG